MKKLTLDDIIDLRAYERERDDVRRRIIDLKRRRRVGLGDIMSVVFENTDTMWFQVQEMARAERMMRDEQIMGEIETYNELVPDDGELSGTLFLELVDDDALREWLPKLVGIDRAIAIDLGDGSCVVGEPQDEERLTREETTAAVHFLKFRFTPEQADRFCDPATPARLVVDHGNYRVSTPLEGDARTELKSDLEQTATVENA